MIPKSKVTAAMLAFFLGAVGAHKLYLGKTGGFVWFMILLMLSISIGIPITLILGVIHGVKLINMTDQAFDKMYNKGYAAPSKGPLETRRSQQMERYEQVSDSAQRQPSFRKPSPTASAKSNPYKNSGIKKYKDFDLADAIADFSKGLEISPNDLALHFNIACAYSLTENKSKAYHHLSKAVSLGLKDVERILSHDDLAYVRIQPEFDTFRSSGFRVNPYETRTTNSQSQTSAPSAAPVDIAPETMDDTLLAQLNKLSELRKRGILSDDEFNFERKRLLRQ
jgi:TM2 domain-containing membrane protein YozV